MMMQTGLLNLFCLHETVPQAWRMKIKIKLNYIMLQIWLNVKKIPEKTDWKFRKIRAEP